MKIGKTLHPTPHTPHPTPYPHRKTFCRKPYLGRGEYKLLWVIFRL
ncbi:MAG: hypothetical protein PX634_03140 [Microcystis sp. M53600_WE12]|nr:hypothetical protein [Microcystis sp. M53600_WE12]